MAKQPKSWLGRHLQRLEPALQHDGFAYTFTIVFLLVNVIIFFVGAAPAWLANSEEGLALRLAASSARGGGAMLNLDAALVILVASRSLMTYLRRTPLNMIVPFDKAMPAFHSLVGNVLVVATVIHTLGHIVRYSLLREWGGGILGPTSLAFSGSFLVIVVLSMKITALKSLRKRSYETFYWVHSLGLFFFFALLIMHGSHNGQAKTFMYILAPLTIYIIDRLDRKSVV